MAILEKIELFNVSCCGRCNLFHHGVVQDCLQKSDFKFISGNLYGIIGEFGEGGAALSCGMTGNIECVEGKINIDGNDVTINDLIDISWYIGNDLYKYGTSGLFINRPKFNKKTIHEQIEYGVRRQLIDKDFTTIKEMFHISDERVDRNINYVSGERWKASAAIGYSNGKKLFCYPWMNSNDIEHLKEQIAHTVKILIDEGNIIILPTTKAKNIQEIYADGICVFL